MACAATTMAPTSGSVTLSTRPPPETVSGGDVLVRVDVIAILPLNAVRVTLNGTTSRAPSQPETGRRVAARPREWTEPRPEHADQ